MKEYEYIVENKTTYKETWNEDNSSLLREEKAFEETIFANYFIAPLSIIFSLYISILLTFKDNNYIEYLPFVFIFLALIWMCIYKYHFYKKKMNEFKNAK